MRRVLVLLPFAFIALEGSARADADAGAADAKSDAQGIAVIARGEAKNEAFDVARAIYASSLRPHGLDEVRARVLAGGELPSNATRELAELAQIRGAISGEDAPSRRLLTGVAQQMHVQALVVVAIEGDADAGAPKPVARLFLPDAGEFDAARYEPEASDAGKPSWRPLVISLERRFPPTAREVARPAATLPPAALHPEKSESKPFYASGWFWGAVAGAALIGGVIFFASRDTTDETIHLQMRVPR